MLQKHFGFVLKQSWCPKDQNLQNSVYFFLLLQFYKHKFLIRNVVCKSFHLLSLQFIGLVCERHCCNWGVVPKQMNKRSWLFIPSCVLAFQSYDGEDSHAHKVWLLYPSLLVFLHYCLIQSSGGFHSLFTCVCVCVLFFLPKKNKK